MTDLRIQDPTPLDRRRSLHLAIAAALVALAVPATSPVVARVPSQAAESVMMRGRIVSADTGEPIPNARVTVGGTVAAVRTTPDGRFAIAASRNARIVVTKAGYLRQEAALAAANSVQITRAAAISGRVVDDRGDPVVGAFVAAVMADKPAGAIAVLSTRVTTDDRGEYRIAGLAPASYIVAVTILGTSIDVRESYTTYYPTTTDRARAALVSLRPGDDRGDIDFHPASSRLSMNRDGLPTLILPDALTNTAGTARITGLISSTNGRPLRARVVIYGADPRKLFNQATTSTDDGRYEFTGLPAGSYRVGAGRPGFSMPPERLSPVSLSTFGVPVSVGNDEVRDRVDVELQPWGSISGHVLDEAGEPVQDAFVGLLVVRYERGRRRLVPAALPQRYTDDRGYFRIYSVPPGQYVVGASVSDTMALDLAGYASTYFPGTAATAEARLTTVRLGQDIGGLDFNLVPTPTVNVSGRLVDPAGNPTRGGRFELIGRSNSARIGARIDADGTFSFRNVPPGQYVMQADRGRIGGWHEGAFVAVPISVGGSDISGLLVQTSDGSRVIGRVVFESATSATPPPQSLTISPIPSDYDFAPGSLAMADPDAEGRFELRGLNGARRLQVTRVPDGWTVKAILSNGRDITDDVIQFGRADQTLEDVEVVLTDRISAVTGRVTDDRLRPVSAASVIVFSADQTRWYPVSRFMRTATTAADGSFKLTGLPTGTYFVAAVLSTPPGDAAWGDPVFLESIRPTAALLSLSDDQAQSVSLRVSR